MMVPPTARDARCPRLRFLALLAAVAVVLAGCNGGRSAGSGATPSPTEEPTLPTVLGVLQADSRFETLVEAVQADPLFRDAMGRPNWNHTVLAPRDEAFQALPEQGVRGLLDDPDRLRTWLDNHVLFELVPSDRLAGEELETIRGFHTLQVDDDVIRVDDVEVVEADIVASNGLIHAIDGVLTSLCLKVGVGNPPTCTDLLEGG